jgi:hypothetical protein
MAGTSSYMLAADNHNLLNTGTSWTDPETWTTKLGNAGKFVATAALSGANSLYNSAAQIGSWLGADTQQNDTARWIADLDTDLGTYYRANKESADLVGFVAGSIIPGLAGVKLFNIGLNAVKGVEATGFVGGGIARATGMLVPKTEMYVSAAAAEINSSLAGTSLMNANTLKALASGVYTNVLESAAFEVAVTATMFKSPVLEDKDIGDIMSNIATGAALGGVIGGAFTGAGIFGKLRTARTAEDVLRRPFLERPAFAEATSPSERIVQLAYDTEMAAVPVVVRGADDAIVNNFQVNQNLYNAKIDRNFLDIRTATHQLTGNDTQLGNLVANFSMPVKNADGTMVPGFAQQTFQNFSGAVRIARVTELTAPEIKAAKAARKGEAVEVPVAPRFVKLFGDDAGAVTDEAPKLISLGDAYPTPEAIIKSVKAAKFDIKMPFNMAELTGVRAHLEAEKRYIWASRLKEIPDDTLIHGNDIPLLERAWKDKQLNIKIAIGEGPTLEVLRPGTLDELWQHIKTAKVDLAADHFKRIGSKIGDDDLGIETAAKIANVRRAYLEGTHSPVEELDLLAHQANATKYLESLKARGLSTKAGAEIIDPMYLPKHAKVVYAVGDNIAAIEGNVLDAMVYYKSAQKIYQEGNTRVATKLLGEYSSQLPDLTDRVMLTANRTGAGANLLTGAAGSYGRLDSFVEQIGKVTSEVKGAWRKRTGDELAAPLTRLGSKQEAAFEFESINQKVSRSGKQFVVRENSLGEKGLVDAKIAAKAEDGIVDYELLDDLSWIPIKHEETLAAVEAHIGSSAKRTTAYKEIRAQQGHTDGKIPDVFRPIRPDLRNYPHFAFVRDPAVTGAGHTTMIHAASDKELVALIDKVPSRYKVITKSDSEDFFKARGEYEHARTLNENYINSELANKGVFSNFFPKSDPQKIIDDVLQQHYRESEVLAQETIRLRYEPQFAQLEDMGKEYSKFATSRFASSREAIERTTNNPYFNYIKTALNISKVSENHLVYGFNKLLDEAVSKASGAIWQSFKGVKTPEDLGKINAMLDEYGMKPAFYDASLQALANHSAPRGVLTQFVRKANSLLSLFTLGLDPLNAVNNAVGSNFLRMTELRFVTAAIKAGNGQLAGELAELAKITLPGTGDQILAPTKLVSRAIDAFWKDQRGNGSLIEKYKKMGLIKDRAEQLKLLVDDFTLTGTETVADLNKRMGTAFDRAKDLAGEAAAFGEKATGNKLAEELNRFISANVMDQITGLAVRHGLMDDKTAQAYINTFVNRVEGNIVASQRPLIFQGPIGQAIGLFQSYQFNLLQQLFRYVAEGSKKDLAMLAGLQSTIYGIQSMPAFQFINVHIIGQMSGNPEHKDTYDAVYGAAGKTAGNFILYGIPSNILQANIYSRGDINPRQITILPTSLQETPIVAGWGKFLGSMKETFGKVANGGDMWESILQGMEHNGISRPLAGFAQVLQATGPEGKAYSTSNQGSILYSNDLMSWASMVRLAGGRPLDEARVNDAMFRVRTYEAAQREKMKKLAETVKTSLIQGNQPTPEQLEEFAAAHASRGGKQTEFNKWMMGLYKNANVSQAEQLEMNLKSPFNQKLQLLMGGSDPNE